MAAAVTTPLSGVPQAVPEPLAPWVPWVLDRHPDLACPRLDGDAVCVWPGRLSFDLDEEGGTFRLEVTADAPAVVELPGDAAHWPVEVTLDGIEAVLRGDGGLPVVKVEAGRHRLAGQFRWSRRPESLPVPASVATIGLRLDGREVKRPRREADGRLWLGKSREDAQEADRLELAVHRLLADGVPLTLETRLVFYVAGSARAVTLPSPLPEGFVPTGLAGELPARWLDGERLRVRVRPGTWELKLSARGSGPVAEVAFGTRPEPWPQEELWAFRAAPELRAVEIGGAPGVDPRRTAVPEEWHELPTYRLAPGRRLVLEELRRGTEAPRDLLRVARRVWLTGGGGPLLVEDLIEGFVHATGRLEALAPGELGRVRLDHSIRGVYRYGRDDELPEQVLTVPGDDASGASRPGVTVHPGPLHLRSEVAYAGGRTLPAVGWNLDAERLKVDLHLPLGWTLLAAWGADHAVGSWSDGFSPLDLLLLILLGFFTLYGSAGRRLGRGWGVALAVFFVLGLQEPFGRVAAVAWLAWLATPALDGSAGRFQRALRWGVPVAAAALLAVFAAVQWRTGFHPELQLPMPQAAYDALAQQGLSNPGAYAPDLPPAEGEWWSALQAAAALAEPEPLRISEPGTRPRPADLEEVAQTGLGLPRWQGKTCRLYWNGRVSSERTLRLWLLPPAVELLLSVLRALAAFALAVWLWSRRGSPPATASPTAAAVLLAGVTLGGALAASPAQAEEPAPPEAVAETAVPSSVIGLLGELEERLTRPPECHPSCVEVARIRLSPAGGELRLAAEVHASAEAVWRLPGPAASWTPQQVTVGGVETVALRRGEDGFLALRLPPGRHSVEATGPAADAVDLVMPRPPRRLDFAGDGWVHTGAAPGEPPPGAVRLDRLPSAGAGAEGSDQPFDPGLELRRRIVVDVPWQVYSELRRGGSFEGVVAVRVPLLPGETVTTPGIAVESGEVLLRLEPGEGARAFTSRLAERESLRLEAPLDEPWLERWELLCSRVWSCLSDAGLPGRLDRQVERQWATVWQPWPGEAVTLAFSRPQPAGGPTTTVDAAALVWTPGHGTSQARLSLDVRTSVAAERSVRLPPSAELERFTVGGEPRATRFDGGRLRFTLPPGEHQVAIEWSDPRSAGWLSRPPAVDAGAVANVQVTVKVPADRRVLAVGGPGTGPVIESWAWLLLVAIAAVVLCYCTEVPIAVHEWLLLAFGVLQLPHLTALLPGDLARYLPDFGWPPWFLGAIAFAAVATWLIASRYRFGRAWLRALLGILAIGALAAAVAVGLAAEPAAHVQQVSPEGLPVYTEIDGGLTWYVDRAGEALPRPWVLWLPTWAWRALVLAWALWLAGRLAAWSPWLFRGSKLGTDLSAKSP